MWLKSDIWVFSNLLLNKPFQAHEYSVSFILNFKTGKNCIFISDVYFYVMQ